MQMKKEVVEIEAQNLHGSKSNIDCINVGEM